MRWCLRFDFGTREKNRMDMNSLHIAAKRGCCAIAELLVAADNKKWYDLVEFINSEGPFQSTPLYIAAKFGNKEVVEWLLNK